MEVLGSREMLGSRGDHIWPEKLPFRKEFQNHVQETLSK